MQFAQNLHVKAQPSHHIPTSRPDLFTHEMTSAAVMRIARALRKRAIADGWEKKYVSRPHPAPATQLGSTPCDAASIPYCLARGEAI